MQVFCMPGITWSISEAVSSRTVLLRPASITAVMGSMGRLPLSCPAVLLTMPPRAVPLSALASALAVLARMALSAASAATARVTVACSTAAGACAGACVKQWRACQSALLTGHRLEGQQQHLHDC